MKKIIYSFLFSFIIACPSLAQDQQIIIQKMKEEVTYLASDKLEGRATGTPSEKMAAKYISSKFKEYNLAEKGEDGQPGLPGSDEDFRTLTALPHYALVNPPFEGGLCEE